MEILIMKYLVQAILIDNMGNNIIETVTDSFRTDDYERTLKFAMQKHKHNYHYQYNVLDTTNNNIILTTKNNYYAI